MLKWINSNKTILLTGIFISASIPIFITSYEIIILGKDSVRFTFDSTLGLLVILYYVLLIIMGISYLFYWLIMQIKAIKTLKNEKTNAELLHLKAQVNPHFFFNMLNNLYGWIDKDSEKAKELIIKLSDMMRYSIYDGQKDKVAIKEEIVFLKNYIELHKMRYHKNINIDFANNIQNDNMQVMPLLFIILMENAFKHGVETLRNNAFVNIKLDVNENKIHFRIQNNFETLNKKEEGIGLKNLKRRLALMYPNKHEFITKSKDNIFTAQLILSIL